MRVCVYLCVWGVCVCVYVCVYGVEYPNLLRVLFTPPAMCRE